MVLKTVGNCLQICKSWIRIRKKLMRINLAYFNKQIIQKFWGEKIWEFSTASCHLLYGTVNTEATLKILQETGQLLFRSSLIAWKTLIDWLFKLLGVVIIPKNSFSSLHSITIINLDPQIFVIIFYLFYWFSMLSKFIQDTEFKLLALNVLEGVRTKTSFILGEIMGYFKW